MKRLQNSHCYTPAVRHDRHNPAEHRLVSKRTRGTSTATSRKPLGRTAAAAARKSAAVTASP